MTRTQRTIGISAFVMLAVLGTGWALEKGYSSQRGFASDEPSAESDPINAPDSTQPMDEQPALMLRWESLRDTIPGPHVSGKTVIVGHTSQKGGEVLDLGHLVCIDTYCHGGGWLTALDVKTREVWQASQAGEVRRR